MCPTERTETEQARRGQRNVDVTGRVFPQQAHVDTLRLRQCDMESFDLAHFGVHPRTLSYRTVEPVPQEYALRVAHLLAGGQIGPYGETHGQYVQGRGSGFTLNPHTESRHRQCDLVTGRALGPNRRASHLNDATGPIDSRYPEPRRVGGGKAGKGSRVSQGRHRPFLDRVFRSERHRERPPRPDRRDHVLGGRLNGKRKNVSRLPAEPPQPLHGSNPDGRGGSVVSKEPVPEVSSTTKAVPEDVLGGILCAEGIGTAELEGVESFDDQSDLLVDDDALLN